MFAHCVFCPSSESFGSADDAETWAAEHEALGAKHSVKVEGYERDSDGKA